MDSPQDALPERPANAGEVERIAAVIGESRRARCGGRPYDAETALNPWLTDEDRATARAILAALTPETSKEGWDHRYRPLAWREIILATDECRRDDGTWVTGICVGQPAPDPAYTSHRIYRRLKVDNSKEGADVLEVARAVAAKLLGYRDWDDATDYRTTGAQDRQRDATLAAFIEFAGTLRASQPPEQARMVLVPRDLTYLPAVREAAWKHVNNRLFHGQETALQELWSAMLTAAQAGTEK